MTFGYLLRGMVLNKLRLTGAQHPVLDLAVGQGSQWSTRVMALRDPLVSEHLCA